MSTTRRTTPQQKRWLLATASLTLLVGIGAAGLLIRSGGGLNNPPTGDAAATRLARDQESAAMLRSVITATYTPDCTLGTAWRVVASPDLILAEVSAPVSGGSSEGGGNNLNQIAVLSESDAWAVGTVHGEGEAQSLVQRWDGVTWRTLDRRNVLAEGSALNALAAISSNDVWVAGSHVDKQGQVQPLVEHWNGSAWAVTPNAPGLPRHSELYGITASSPGDVWAVGYSISNEGGYNAHIQHWQGQGWATVESAPLATKFSQLQAVRAISPQDVWAVGQYIASGATYKSLIEHWDGSKWAVVPSLNGGTLSNYLVSLAATGPTDVWAAGYSANATGGYRTLIEHWDGTAWSIVPSPSVGERESRLSSISATAPNDAWAAGHYLDEQGYKTLVEHWDGSAWSVVPSPNTGVALDMLKGISALSPTYVWAAGYRDSPGKTSATLIQRYNNPCANP